jgi:CRP/FNR family cyclic AMP-dependent transcriptional regulator
MDVHRQPRDFWSRLTPEQQNLLKRVGNTRNYDSGQTLIRGADQGTWVAVLTSGRVRVIGHGADRTRVIAHRHAGDIVGELAVIGSAVRLATVSAITRVGALCLSGAQLGSLTREHPQILRALLSVVAERVAESDQHRIEIDTEPKVKVARALFGAARRDGVPIKGGLEIYIASQSDFASIIGASRATLQRVLLDLRAAGVLTTKRGVVVIRDIDRLRERARLS